jgi:hypothetical protein
LDGTGDDEGPNPSWVSTHYPTGGFSVAQRTNRVAWGLAAVLAGMVLGGTAVSAARSKAPRTVVDFYLLLPGSYFEIDRRSLLDPKYGAIVDIKNGYLRTWHDGAQVQLNVCLFRRPDRSYLVAVSGNYGDLSASWAPFLCFYVYQSGHLVDVTKATQPAGFDENLEYDLPRYGTTITGFNEAGKRIHHLVWRNGRFQAKRRITRAKLH